MSLLLQFKITYVLQACRQKNILQNFKQYNDRPKIILNTCITITWILYDFFFLTCIYRDCEQGAVETEKERYVFPFHFITSISKVVIK
jgi:hypothetical protein